MTDRKLAEKIQGQLLEVSSVFNDFQNKTTLTCPSGCGKCCMKSDISCAPYELLPLAFHLLDTGKASDVLEKAHQHTNTHCLFLEVQNASLGLGKCSEYEHRPFICRAFGLTARLGKYKIIERSICAPLSEKETSSPDIKIVNEDIPLIDVWKRKLESIDPHLLEKEVPIHQGIIFVLEKLILWQKFQLL